MEGLYLASGIPSGIVDLEGNILVQVGWHDICMKFHRVNSETELMCRQSDKYLQEHMQKCGGRSEPYLCYTCLNGLIDAAAPIMIEGEHLATIFQGQFLFAEPDLEEFRARARKYGFDEEKYLKYLASVPIYSKKKLDSIMHYFIQLAEMLGQKGVDHLREIDSQKKALQESEKRLKTIIKNTPNVAIQSYDEEGRIQFINDASEDIFGWVNDEVIGKTLDQLVLSEDYANKFLDLLKYTDQTGNPIKTREWTFKNKEGREKIVLSTIFPISVTNGKKEFISIDLDITEKRFLEKEMFRLEQLNLVGQMAAGIGHEVRNPMTTVRGLLQLFSKRENYQRDKEYFELMIQELDRANSIITEFLSLAKNKAISLELKNLNTVTSDFRPLIESMVRESDKDLLLELGEIPEFLFDEKEIRQLLLNLSKNGIEAMSSRGCLTIRTYMQNDEVVLAVEDEGGGINPEIIDKIGIPFFTTKDNGTGLGLATCYSIAARQNAKISVESREGKTTFSVHFNPEYL
jgi:PAS domain S-box-containing protein